MNRKRVSLRLLQGYSLFSATIAVLGGGTFVLAGIDGVAKVVGTEYSALVPMLEEAAANIDPEAKVTFSTWYRALGWYWLVTGLMLFWITPKVHLRTDWFRLVHIAFMAVGVASLMSIAEYGTNTHNRYGAVVFELGIPAGAMLWQWFVARSASEV